MNQVMNKNSKIETLHQKAIEVAQKFHRAESELLDILQEIDEKKVFTHLGFNSLFDYAVKALKLSEANSSNFIAVARKSKTVPELKLAIQKGELTVSVARKLTPILTQSNSSQWIELAQSIPKAKLEKEIAKVAPKTLTSEKIKYVTETRMELKCGLSEESSEKLKRAQDLVSQKLSKAATLEDTIDELLEFYLQRQDPLEKAKRIISHANTDANTNDTPASKTCPGTRSDNVPPKIGRIPLSAATKHAINLRDQGQCSHMNEKGERCDQRRWLEVHHLNHLCQWAFCFLAASLVL